MSNVYARELGEPLPTCCNLGSCCKGASPSTPYHQLLSRAVNGDEFARGFFSIMVPYASHADAEKIVPGIVERTLLAAQKQEAFKTSADVVFYSCRYQTADNRCGVWEDRPQFCRDYPDTPFVVMAPGCAFEGWAKNCKEKFYAMKAEVAQLKAMKQELDQLKSIQSLSGLQELPNAEKEGVHEPSGTQNRVAGSDPYPQIDALFRASGNTDNLSLVLSLTRLYVGSPMNAVFFIR